MERLTERNPLWIDDEMWERACEPDCEEIDAVYRKFKDYEDEEEQGLLLGLPCDIGERIFLTRVEAETKLKEMEKIDKEKPQTNADRIRSMTDEELAVNMMCPNENGLAEIDCDKNDNCNCYECLLKWLRAESEE